MVLLFLKELRHRWNIYLLVVFLVAFIVSILVIQSSINSSANEKIKELSHKLGRSMLVVPEGTDLERFYRMQYGTEFMPDDYGDRLKASPLGKHVSMVDPRLYGNITLQGKDIILIGRQMKAPTYTGLNYTPAAVSGGAAAALGLSPGSTLDINGKTLRIMRVIDPPPKGLDMALFVPLNVAQAVLEKPGKINAIYMGGCWCEMDVPAFALKVEKNLPGTTAVTVESMAKAQTEINGIMERYSTAVWIAGALLAVGSIVFLIFYIMHKGNREIGLLLSIGLSPGRIVVKNIATSLITAVSGVFLGYALSVPLMSYIGRTFIMISLNPSWGLLPWFVAGSLVAALIASFLPSWYVTRLDPTKILREE